MYHDERSVENVEDDTSPVLTNIISCVNWKQVVINSKY